MPKYRKISMARSPLATARKLVSDGMNEVACRPDSVSIETKLASRSVSTLRAKLDQPLRLFGLKSPLQPHTRLKDLSFKLLKLV